MCRGRGRKWAGEAAGWGRDAERGNQTLGGQACLPWESPGLGLKEVILGNSATKLPVSVCFLSPRKPF